MEQTTISDSNILYQSVLLILDSYQHHYHYLLPDWLLRIWHPRVKQMNYIKGKIELAWQTRYKKTDNQSELEDELIKILDNERYFLSTHTNSKRLRDLIQDAMVTCLFFTEKNVEDYKLLILERNDTATYLATLQQNEELLRFQQYYRKQHAIYGRFIEKYSADEIEIAAKSGMVNGKIIDRYGIKAMLEHGLHYIRRELKNLQKKHIEAGFLKLQFMEGYIEKMDFLLHPANELQNDDAALIQNARYLLEDIMNAAGVLNEGKATHLEHQSLIAGCYWVDELFKMLKVKVDLESL